MKKEGSDGEEEQVHYTAEQLAQREANRKKLEMIKKKREMEAKRREEQTQADTKKKEEQDKLLEDMKAK